MDEKEIIKWGLIALGAYLIYEYIQQQGGLTNVLAGSTTAGTTTTGTTATQAQLQNAIAQLTPMGITLSAAQQTSILSGAITNFQQLLTPAQMEQFTAYGKTQAPPIGGSASTTAPPPVTSCPMGQVLQGGVCVTAPPASQPALLMSQQVLNAATAAGEPNNLNIDQWNFYYQQITGQQVSLPEIPTSVYTSAGVQPNADGSGPDNTSPMPVSTWLAIMQLEMPQLGLSGFRGGMGTFAKYRPHWLN